MTMIDQQLSASFRLSEFLRSESAMRRGLDNIPPAAALANLRNVLAPNMQRVRDILQSPVFITSGYRSPAVNALIGGSPRSQHVQGLAADFVAPNFGSPRAIAKHLQQHVETLRYDQLIFEGTWVHLSFPGDGTPRRETLTAHFAAGGGVSYSSGIA